MLDPDVSVSAVVRCPVDVVWAAIADPVRIAQWSPESSGVSVDPGPLATGARFGGANRNGLFRWSTSCVVVESAPGHAFAFDVTYLGFAVARWRYVVTTVDGGCSVEEQWWDRRGPMMKAVGIVGTGVVDRARHNEETMTATLAALCADLEADAEDGSL